MGSSECNNSRQTFFSFQNAIGPNEMASVDKSEHNKSKTNCFYPD